MQDRMGFYNINLKYTKYLLILKTNGRGERKKWVYWTQTPQH